ncbi:hypothetical protein CRENPOLYSF1_850008 [Crenothrix polyspora]|uniref:Uncharacterized protein n=1 Tax=Crenothrix polyspora TaxID=360316 RepID=A0A1R4HIQ8_9GAMM|nr:hypothetical protein CRENPOLYSF1_850008 [Crenothrix polyspora]
MLSLSKHELAQVISCAFLSHFGYLLKAGQFQVKPFVVRLSNHEQQPSTSSGRTVVVVYCPVYKWVAVIFKCRICFIQRKIQHTAFST